MAVYGATRPPPGASLGQKSFNQFKKGFFDSQVVLRGMNRAAAKALSKFGAFVRTKARTSLRYRNTPSKPGQPPSAHKSGGRNKTNKKGVTSRQSFSPLRDFLFFAYERERQSVVIGPAKTNQRNSWGYGGAKTIPETLEYGGSIRIREHQLRNGDWVRTDMRFTLNEGPRSAVGRPQRQRLAEILARPYMQPAFDSEIPKLAGFFKDAM